jgi:hypothetical protein
MVSRGFAYEFNRESPPAMYRQSFAHVGNMQSGPDMTPDYGAIGTVNIA